MKMFREESSDSKTNAQRNLSGRTHYVDDDTLRYFHSRILSSHTIADGLLFYIVESLALDHRNSKRGFRAVAFDVFGEIVYRPSLEECVSSSDAAVKRLAKFLPTFDAKAHTLSAIETSREYHLKELAEFEEKVKAMEIKEAA